MSAYKISLYKKKKFCVFGCEDLGQQNVALHRFPNPETRSELFAAWVSAVGDKLRQIDHSKIHKYRRICDHHFEPSQKICNNRLIWSAIPTINLKRVQLSIASIVDMDHNYSFPRRDLDQLPRNIKHETTSITNTPDDTMLVSDLTVAGRDVTLECGDVSMYNDERSFKDDDIGSQPSNYRCNECGETITGFRYTCVQCADWDLCAACEARAAHDAHYVLRVPGHRPYKEIQAVLAAIRRQMLTEHLFLPVQIESIKEEVKDEDAEVPESASELAADPLAAWDTSQHDADCDTLEIYPERKDKDGHPPRKRRRTSLDSLAETQNFTTGEVSSYVNLATVTDDALLESNKDGNRSDDSEICDQSFDYSEPIEIEIIDIEKLIKTQEQTEQDSNKIDTNTIEKCIDMSLDKRVSPRDCILDTCESKLQHNKHEQLVEMGTYSNGIETSNEGIARHSAGERTGTHTEGTGALSQTKKGKDSKGIAPRSISNTGARIKKRYKIPLPPGAHWKQLLMTMLKSRVTVQVEDVMRKKEVHIKTEINEI